MNFISNICQSYVLLRWSFIYQRKSCSASGIDTTRNVSFIIHRIYSKGYAYVAFRCVCLPEMCTVAACDTRSACRERDSLGIRFRKEGGTPRLLSSWYTHTHTLSLSFVRTSAKQMSHRSRSTDAHRRSMFVKIVSLGRNKSYFPLPLYDYTCKREEM